MKKQESIKNLIVDFWAMKPHCRLGGGTSYFGGTHCLHVHNQKAII
jgi:hypothetical protein